MDSARIFVDSINATVKFSSEIPVTRQACQANWMDVAIVAIISLSVIAIVGICVYGYKCIQKQKIDACNQTEKDKRVWETEDKMYKQKIVQKERKLNFLKEFCYDEIEVCEKKVESERKKLKEEETRSIPKKECKKMEKKLKAYDSNEVKEYLNELNS